MISGLFIGALFGALLQAGQFCFVSGFRRIYTQKNTQFLTAVFIAISIQSIGLFALQDLGVISLPNGDLPLVATLVGGFLFGFGMNLAGCCGSGAWFRSGEGLVGSWLALMTFSITMASTQTGSLKPWIQSWTNDSLPLGTIYNSLQISPWILTAVLCLITLALYLYQRKHPRFSPPRSKFSLNLNSTAVLIGLLGIVAWYLSAQTGRNFGFGIAVPSANVVQYLVTGQQRYFNWGSLFVIGILIGAMIMAKIRGELQLTFPPDSQTVFKRLIGGILMAIGASLAGGCTVTNSLVATAYFSWQGWLATVMIMIGLWISSAIFKPTQCKI